MNKVYVTPNQASEANLNENKRILKYSPFIRSMLPETGLVRVI